MATNPASTAQHLFIADAQIHLWSQGEPMSPHRPGPYLAADALLDMDAAGVDRALIHPPIWDPQSQEIALEAAAQHPERFALLGWVPPLEEEGAAALETLRARPGVKGLRYVFLHEQQRQWLYDGSMDWLWSTAEKARLPIALAAAGHFGIVAEIARRHPGLPLMIDHMGVPRGLRGPEAFAGIPELCRLAAFPNIAVKATAGPDYVTEAYPYPGLQVPYRAILEAFGARRMFWGTDITRMPCNWSQCIAAFTEGQRWISRADQAQILGLALCDWIAWRP